MFVFFRTYHNKLHDHISVRTDQSVTLQLQYLQNHLSPPVQQEVVGPRILGKCERESVEHSLLYQLAALSAGIPAKMKRYE